LANLGHYTKYIDKRKPVNPLKVSYSLSKPILKLKARMKRFNSLIFHEFSLDIPVSSPLKLNERSCCSSNFLGGEMSGNIEMIKKNFE